MKRLVNDNAIKIFQNENYEIGKCSDDKEFFQLLKLKISDNLNKLFDVKDIEKKKNALSDIYYDLEIISSKLHKTPNEQRVHLDKRIRQIGEYKNKYWAEEIREEQRRSSDKYDFIVDIVAIYGEKNNYPSVVLKRDDDGNPIKVINAGKENWDNAIAWKDMDSPYKENYDDLVRAVSEKDFIGVETI